MNQSGKWTIAFLVVVFSLGSLGMGSRGEYDEEAREMEKLEKEARKSGQLPADEALPAVTEEESDEVRQKSALQSASQTGKDAVNKTLKSTVKVATLGYGKPEDIRVEEPEKDSGEPTKFKIRF